MTRYSAVLFDCDGVLLDSEPMGGRALHQAITDAGLNISYSQVVSDFCGNTAKGCELALAALGLDVAVFQDADRILFELFSQDVPLIPGVERILAGLLGKRAVCSNSHVRRLDLSLGRTCLAPYFNGHIYSAEMVAAGKPAPDMIYLACDRLGIDPASAVFIDDNVQGMTAAKAAGCLPIGFCGPNEHRLDQPDRLYAAGAQHVFHSMDDFGAFLATQGLFTVDTAVDA